MLIGPVLNFNNKRIRNNDISYQSKVSFCTKDDIFISFRGNKDHKNKNIFAKAAALSTLMLLSPFANSDAENNKQDSKLSSQNNLTEQPEDIGAINGDLKPVIEDNRFLYRKLEDRDRKGLDDKDFSLQKS